MGGDIFDHGPALRAWAVETARGVAEALGLFASIGKWGPQEVGALAGRLAVAPERLRAVVDVLVLDGALARREGRLALGDGRGAPPSPSAEALVAALRSDRARDAEETLSAHHAHLFSVGAAAAAELWARLGARGSLVDLGGGQGAYTRAWLDAGEGRVATLVDRAPVLALARAALGDRAGLRLVDGDLLDGAAPVAAPHAVALVANVVHLLRPDDAARAIARAAGWVRPGDGLVVVKDLFVAPDRSGPEVALLFALTMALYADGTVYDVPTLRGWMEAAGLVDLRTLALEAAPDSVVLVGRRP